MLVAAYKPNGQALGVAKSRLWAARKDLGDFDLAPDGRRFAVVQAELTEQKTPKHVVSLLNFFDELRRRAPAAGK